ncbi:NUDIX domain-containing protein [Candidatus Saccharibacteria bacterium]|nr:NUDIX domain-containing protein [Candidatus Saccharibacteria bacterium]
MHHDEAWQVFYPNGEPIRGEGWNSALDNPEKTGVDKIVGVAIVFLYRLNEQGKLELLWQKRSDAVDRYPGYYDISAGGHINLGETVIEGAIREAKEEIGAEILPEDLQFAFTKPFNKNRFAWIFMVDWTGKLENFQFNDKEVSEVKWVSYDENEAFRKEFAKPPLAKDDLTFMNLNDWFKMREIV